MPYVSACGPCVATCHACAPAIYGVGLPGRDNSVTNQRRRQHDDQCQEYVSDIQKAAGFAMQKTQFPLTANPTNENYVPYNTYLEALIEVCTQMVTEKWQGKLKAVSLYTRSHCWRSVIDAQID